MERPPKIWPAFNSKSFGKMKTLMERLDSELTELSDKINRPNKNHSSNQSSSKSRKNSDDVYTERTNNNSSKTRSKNCNNGQSNNNKYNNDGTDINHFWRPSGSIITLPKTISTNHLFNKNKIILVKSHRQFHQESNKSARLKLNQVNKLRIAPATPENNSKQETDKSNITNSNISKNINNHNNNNENNIIMALQYSGNTGNETSNGISKIGTDYKEVKNNNMAHNNTNINNTNINTKNFNENIKVNSANINTINNNKIGNNNISNKINIKGSNLNRKYYTSQHTSNTASSSNMTNYKNNNNNNMNINNCKTSTNNNSITTNHINNNKYIQVAKPPNVTVDDNIAQLGMQSWYKPYKMKVFDAYKTRRIFLIYGDYLESIKRALRFRGWLQKLSPAEHPQLQHLSDDILLQNIKSGNNYETAFISKLMKNFPAFFIWQIRQSPDLYADVLPYRNRVRHTACMDFTTKTGLIGCAEHEKWYKIEGLSDMTYPRFYRVSTSLEERQAFIEDYRLTQCRSLLEIIVEFRNQLDVLANATEGTVDPGIIKFAVKQVHRQLSECNNDCDGNDSDDDASITSTPEFNDFMRNSALITLTHNKFKAAPSEIAQYVEVGQIYLPQLTEKYPDYKWDGYRNLWILKPSFEGRGFGITVKSSLNEILNIAVERRRSEYIVQKYIERPLLMYNAKFDIRHYMLLVFGKTLVSIWFYKDCYFRISSHVYDMNDLGEAIHLTNHTVAKRYKISASRDKRLPQNNMCSLETFKAYLKSINAPENVWEKNIFPAFRRSIIPVILASIDETNLVENCFELYGCDFMLDANYDPVLIEINNRPDMSPSTAVTARLFPLLLNDVVRVIVDLPQNAKASTGDFELIFQIPYTIESNFDPKVGMPVEGKAIILYNPEPIIEPIKPANKFFKRNATSVRNTTTRMSVGGKDVKLHEPEPIVQPFRAAAKCFKEDNKSVQIVDPGPSIPNTQSSGGIQTFQPVQLRPIQLEGPIRRFHVKRFFRKLKNKINK